MCVNNPFKFVKFDLYNYVLLSFVIISEMPSDVNFAINRLLDQEGNKDAKNGIDLSTPGPSSSSSNPLSAAINAVGNPFSMSPFLANHQNPFFRNPAFMFSNLAATSDNNLKKDDEQLSESPESESPPPENCDTNINMPKTTNESPQWLNYLNFASLVGSRQPPMMAGKMLNVLYLETKIVFHLCN